MKSAISESLKFGRLQKQEIFRVIFEKCYNMYFSIADSIWKSYLFWIIKSDDVIF